MPCVGRNGSASRPLASVNEPAPLRNQKVGSPSVARRQISFTIERKERGTNMLSFSEHGAQFRGLVIVLLVGFLIGFVPMWLRARQRTSERDQALHKLQTSELRDQLSAAALDARRGQYEIAREELSGFFTSLTPVIGRKNDPDITPERVASLQRVFSERDELVTLLARNDPASADRLLDLDLAFRKALR
jgi:hypothetical protein